MFKESHFKNMSATCCERHALRCNGCGGTVPFLGACGLHVNDTTPCSCPLDTGSLMTAIANVFHLVHANKDNPDVQIPLLAICKDLLKLQTDYFKGLKL